jgi:hypothetical protein
MFANQIVYLIDKNIPKRKQKHEEEDVNKMYFVNAKICKNTKVLKNILHQTIHKRQHNEREEFGVFHENIHRNFGTSFLAHKTIP